MRHLLTRLACVLVLATVAGCAATEKASAPAKPKQVGSDQVSALDPCANRMHDLCGALLLYYYTHHQLPPTLDELVKLQSLGQQLGLTCPVSKQPYIYNRTGILEMEKNSLVIIYDPEPTHAGTRRAISIIEPRGNEALVAKVVALPESFFLLQKKTP